MDLIITPLHKSHDRKSFDCGEKSLNQYLHNYANQDIKRRINKVFVASPPEKPKQIIGYYSLSAGSLHTSDLPKALQRRPPRYPVSVVLLGRLATANAFQGKGIGSMLIADALQRITHAGQVMAIYAVVVDALNDRAAEFYRQFGFISLPSQPLSMFLPIDAVSALIEWATHWFRPDSAIPK